MKNVEPHVEYDISNQQCAVFLSAKITCPLCNQIAIKKSEKIDASEKKTMNFECKTCNIDFTLIAKSDAILAMNEKIKIAFYDVSIKKKAIPKKK